MDGGRGVGLAIDLVDYEVPFAAIATVIIDRVGGDDLQAGGVKLLDLVVGGRVGWDIGGRRRAGRCHLYWRVRRGDDDRSRVIGEHASVDERKAQDDCGEHRVSAPD